MLPDFVEKDTKRELIKTLVERYGPEKREFILEKVKLLPSCKAKSELDKEEKHG